MVGLILKLHDNSFVSGKVGDFYDNTKSSFSGFENSAQEYEINTEYIANKWLKKQINVRTVGDLSIDFVMLVDIIRFEQNVIFKFGN